MEGEHPPRRRGRPKVDEPSSSVTTWLCDGDYARLAALARREEKSVSALVREVVERKIRTVDDR